MHAGMTSCRRRIRALDAAKVANHITVVPFLFATRVRRPVRACAVHGTTSRKKVIRLSGPHLQKKLYNRVHLLKIGLFDCFHLFIKIRCDRFLVQKVKPFDRFHLLRTRFPTSAMHAHVVLIGAPFVGVLPVVDAATRKNQKKAQGNIRGVPLDGTTRSIHCGLLRMAMCMMQLNSWNNTLRGASRYWCGPKLRLTVVSISISIHRTLDG